MIAIEKKAGITMPGKAHKTRGDAKARAAQRAARKARNKHAYLGAKQQVGNKLPRAKRDPQRKRPRLEKASAAQTGRARGDRTDEDCVREILELVAQGWTAVDALREVGVSGTQWGQWKVDDRFDLQKRYRAAKRSQAEFWADDLVAESKKANQNNFHGPKLRIEVKKWLMGKNHPDFADKSTTVHEGGDKPIRTITSDMTPEQAAEAYAATVRED